LELVYYFTKLNQLKGNSEMEGFYNGHLLGLVVDGKVGKRMKKGLAQLANIELTLN